MSEVDRAELWRLLAETDRLTGVELLRFICDLWDETADEADRFVTEALMLAALDLAVEEARSCAP